MLSNYESLDSGRVGGGFSPIQIKRFIVYPPLAQVIGNSSSIRVLTYFLPVPSWRPFALYCLKYACRYSLGGDVSLLSGISRLADGVRTISLRSLDDGQWVAPELRFDAGTDARWISLAGNQ